MNLLLVVLWILYGLFACNKQKSHSTRPEVTNISPDIDKVGGEKISGDPAGALLFRADDLVLKAARPFDLQGREVRFSPVNRGYSISIATASNSERGTLLTEERSEGPGFNTAWKVKLPFSFPFGGTTWNELFVNTKGNLSFGQPEHALWSKRDPWADGGMRSMASALDLRSADGQEKMIAALWNTFGQETQAYINSSSTQVRVTWIASKQSYYAKDQQISTFAATLFPDGSVVLSFIDVKEPDGIVGLFTGHTVEGPILEDDSTGIVPGSDPSVQIKRLAIAEEDTLLHVTLEMAQPIPATENTGTRSYRIYFDTGKNSCKEFGISIGPKGVTPGICSEPPRVIRYKVNGPKLDVWIAKLFLGDASEVKFWADVVWWGGPEGAFGNIHAANPKVLKVSDFTMPSTKSFTSNDGKTLQGNVYQVFHRVLMSRDSNDLLKQIYAARPSDDDFAVVMTDFPLDDFYGVAGGSGPMNVKIGGIGARTPTDTAAAGYPKLQGTLAVTWAGHPRNQESGTDSWNRYDWKAYGAGLGLLQHELTHRWGMGLSFKHPETGVVTSLVNGDGHWLNELHSAAMFPISSDFSAAKFPESGIMGGLIWTELADGTFSRSYRPASAPAGFTPLELYAMGLIPPEQVPDTFLLEKLTDLGDGRFSANKVPVRIADIIAAMGPRFPPANEAQKEFRLAFYLLYLGEAPDPKMVSRVTDMRGAMKKLLEDATGGRMRIR